jgi:hypothetical protein
MCYRYSPGINKRLIVPFVLNKSKNVLDRNQSDLRRSKLKSCKNFIVEQTKNI